MLGVNTHCRSTELAESFGYRPSAQACLFTGVSSAAVGGIDWPPCQWKLSPDPDPSTRRVRGAQDIAVAALNSRGKAVGTGEDIGKLDSSVYNILNE